MVRVGGEGGKSKWLSWDDGETLSNPLLKAQYDCELGLRNKMSVIDDGESWMSRWQEQVIELKTRSRRCIEQKGDHEGVEWGHEIRIINDHSLAMHGFLFLVPFNIVELV